MAQAQRYRLTLDTLKFCSLVDEPAQPNAKVLAFKRKTGDRAPDNATEQVEATAKFVKASDELGLAFFWAFTSTNDDGSDHFDLQGDAISPDFMKAAMEWCLAGAPVDEMHDENTTAAKTVFAFPMTPDIAKIYGITTKQSGLMIAIKPTEEQLAKLKKGEFTGVSIGGTGIREAVKAAKNLAFVAKATLSTDVVDGHQHVVCFYDDCDPWVQSATSEGAENSHSHGIIRGENGTFEILLDSGHSHAIEAGKGGVVVVPEGSVVVMARAPQGIAPTTNRLSEQALAGKSTHRADAQKVNTMKTAEEQLADLQKSHDRLGRIAKLSGAQKALFDTTPTDEQDSFLAKSNSERDALVTASIEKAKAEGEVVYTSKSTGETYTKRDDTRLVAMAKRLDESAEEVEKADIRKVAAACLGNVAGDDATHDYIVKSIRRGGGTKEVIEAAIKSLSSANAFAKAATRAAGIGGTTPDDGASPLAKFNTARDAFAKSVNKSPAQATADFLSTPEGAELYAATQGGN